MAVVGVFVVDVCIHAGIGVGVSGDGRGGGGGVDRRRSCARHRAPGFCTGRP